MIKYRKTITLQFAKDQWHLESDKGDRYETFAIDNTRTPWTKWWEMQYQSDLRLWQKDILRDFGSKWRDMVPYVVYKRTAGYSQPHDIALARSERNKAWFLITERDFWIQPSDYGQVEFAVADSMGTITDAATRLQIGLVRDGIDYQ